MTRTTMHIKAVGTEAQRLAKEYQILGFNPYYTEQGLAVPQLGGGRRKRKPKPKPAE